LVPFAFCNQTGPALTTIIVYFPTGHNRDVQIEQVSDAPNVPLAYGRFFPAPLMPARTITVGFGLISFIENSRTFVPCRPSNAPGKPIDYSIVVGHRSRLVRGVDGIANALANKQGKPLLEST
jgi:hypothetical protein